jgi:hypothetical protein
MRGMRGDGRRFMDATGSKRHSPGGYMLLSADTLDDAASLVRTHPFVSRGGTLVVSEAAAP